MQRLVRVREVRGRHRLPLLERRGAPEARRVGAQVHRREGRRVHRAQAPGLHRGAGLRHHQPEGHRPHVPRHAREGGHLRRAPRQAPQHGARDARVRRHAGQLRDRPRAERARLGRQGVRGAARRRQIYLHRGRQGGPVVHHPHQGPQHPHNRPDQGCRARRPPRHQELRRGQGGRGRRRRVRDRRVHVAHGLQGHRERQGQARRAGLRRRHAHHPEGALGELGLRRAGLDHRAPGGAREGGRRHRPRPRHGRVHPARGRGHLGQLPRQAPVHPPLHRARHAAAPRRRGHARGQEDGQGGRRPDADGPLEPPCTAAVVRCST
mmetsp:Transcript_18548/g.38870  ORF Transcript_18548/g.38870 Transcript_18548/m.38870 type:complete len:322 (+) Transcript_18548:743-1708(+)